MSDGPFHAFGSGYLYSKQCGSLIHYILVSIGRLWHRFSAFVKGAHAWSSFDKGAIYGSGLQLGHDSWCHNNQERKQVLIGDRVVCRGILRIDDFGCGEIRVSDDVYIGDNCIISSSNHIEIGQYTCLAHGVQIFDNDSHPLLPEEREQDLKSLKTGEKVRSEIKSSPVKIGSRVWVGTESLIIKGVTIGEGSVIAAKSVVTKDVPPRTFYAGNPAKLVSHLDGSPLDDVKSILANTEVMPLQ